MGRTSSNRTSNSLLNLALAAFYLNLTVKTANGSEFYEVTPMVPIPLPPFDGAITPWLDRFGRYSQAGAQGYQGYGDGNKQVGGYRDGIGFHDDLMSMRNAYDIGKAYGGGQDYSKGSVAGGGFRDLSGRNKGHQAAGFSNSYRKDESGDQSTYYDDGLGHNARINYAAQDARSRDQGGAANRGGYHDTNLNRNAIGNAGRYGDNYKYNGYNGGSQAYTNGKGYGTGQGYTAYPYATFGASKGYSAYPSYSGYSGNLFDKGYGGHLHDKGYGGHLHDKGYAGNLYDKGYSGYQYGKGHGGGGYSSAGHPYMKKYPGYDIPYHRHGRLLPPPLLAPNETFLPPIPGTTIKETGLYVIPMPSKLFFDPIPVEPTQ